MAAFNSRSLVFRIASTDFSADVQDVRIKSSESDSDFVSFADAAAGGARKYTLHLKLRQDSGATSLWYYAWNSSGTTVAVEVWPAGRPVSGTASATQPKFAGNVLVVEPNGDFIGGEAKVTALNLFTAEFDWDFTAKPTLTIA